MTETRPWPAYVAVAAMLGLLVAAYLARGDSDATRMSVTPEDVRPGGTVTLRYVEPLTTLDVTFASGDRTYRVSDGQWQDVSRETGSHVFLVDDQGGDTFNVDLPGSAEPGRYRVCAQTVHEFDVAEVDDPADVEVEQLCADLRIS